MSDACRCCFYVIIFLVVCECIAMGLSFIAIRPEISLTLFYLPALDKTLDPPPPAANTVLYFQLMLESSQIGRRLYYDPIHVTFYDTPDSSHPIGNFTMPSFSQGDWKTTKGALVGITGLDREASMSQISAKGSATFRLDVATSVRFDQVIGGWKCCRRDIKVGATVQVDEFGNKLFPTEALTLKSGAANTERSLFVTFIGILLTGWVLLA